MHRPGGMREPAWTARQQQSRLRLVAALEQPTFGRVLWDGCYTAGLGLDRDAPPGTGLSTSRAPAGPGRVRP